MGGSLADSLLILIGLIVICEFENLVILVSAFVSVQWSFWIPTVLQPLAATDHSVINSNKFRC